MRRLSYFYAIAFNAEVDASVGLLAMVCWRCQLRFVITEDGVACCRCALACALPPSYGLHVRRARPTARLVKGT